MEWADSPPPSIYRGHCDVLLRLVFKMLSEEIKMDTQVVLWEILLVLTYTLMAVFGHRMPKWSSDPWKQRRMEVITFFLPFVLLAIYLSGRLWWDFTHPRQWEYAGDDPRNYWWMVPIFWLVLIVSITSILCREWRNVRKEKVRWLLARTEKLIREKQFAEARSCLEAAKVLTGFRDK